MFEVEHDIARQHISAIIADAEHGRQVARARKLRKRAGRIEHAEAGDYRPPALDR